MPRALTPQTARDLAARAARTLATRRADWRSLRAARAEAQRAVSAGAPERAVEGYGRLIREVQQARESLATYDAIAGWLDDGARPPDGLALHAEPPAQILFFVGYSRSGHSLVGSLLDAHPSVSISHELHAVKHLRGGADFARVQRAIQLNSFFFDHFGRGYSGYDYQVEGQSQGRARELVLLGDKKANGTTRLLRRDAQLPAKLAALAPAPVHYVHVVRNPWDNIATKARRAGTSLRWAAGIYFDHVEAVERLQRDYADAVIELFLDDLIAEPHARLDGLLTALGVTTRPEGYLDACSALLFDSPRRTRGEQGWPDELVRELRARMRDCAFLARYADEAVGDRTQDGATA